MRRGVALLGNAGPDRLDAKRLRRLVRTSRRPGSLDRVRLFWLHLQLELERARRYGRCFAIVRLRFKGSERMCGTLIDDLPGQIRFEDAVLVDPDGRCDEALLLLSESDTAAIAPVLTRLGQQHPELGLRAVAAVEFPAGGFTLGALLEALYTQVSDLPDVHRGRQENQDPELEQVAGG